MTPHRLLPAAPLLFALLCSQTAHPADPPPPQTLTVTNSSDLERALKSVRPGTRLLLSPGSYNKVFAGNVKGTPDQPVVIEAADPAHPPVFENQKYGLLLSKVAHLTVRNLVFKTTQGTCLNIDDGDDRDDPSHHIVLENLSFSDIGPAGNNDAIKLSGVTDFTVRHCTATGWGGSAVDLVGCHRGLIDSCTFRGKPGAKQASTVQIKGGSSAVTVRHCNFLSVGPRGINLGGSTDRNVFRPPEANYEARDLTVEGCRFVGSEAPIVFAGIDGSVVRYNTIVSPTKWAVRILQENDHSRMTPCRNGRFENNVVVFEAGKLRRVINTGDNTRPETFTFAGNVWYARDDPQRSKPNLPAGEKNGTYGTDPAVTLSSEGLPATPRTGATASAGADSLPQTADR